MDLPKLNFLNGFTLGASFFFDISRYLTDKYFEIGWGTPRRPPKNQLFEWLNQGCYFCDISRYLTDKYFDIVWGTNPQIPPNGPPVKSIFWKAQARELHFFDISSCLGEKYFDIVPTAQAWIGCFFYYDQSLCC